MNMNVQDTAITEELCPHTGLPVRRRSEWTDVEFDSGYRVTIFLLGDNILVGRPTGYVTMTAVRNVTALSAKIIRECFAPDIPYVQIQDYTGLTGLSLRARKYFIEEMRTRTRIQCLIFCGVSPFFRIAVQLAKRLHSFSYEFRIVRDYPEAALLAKSLIWMEAPSGRGRHAETPAPSIGKGAGSEFTRQYIDDLLHYLNSINWEKDGLATTLEANPAHPFRQVFEAVDLIKKELDDLTRDRRMVEEALRRTQHDLWEKVAERTKELSAAYERIRELEKERSAPPGDRPVSDERP